VPKNLQNKKFCIKLNHKCCRDILESSEHDIYSFIIYTHENEENVNWSIPRNVHTGGSGSLA